GVGKVLSTCVAQRLIDTYAPKALLLTGICGALAPHLAIGDVVIGSEYLQHDLDVEPLGFPRGQIPYTDLRVIRADRTLLEIASSYQSEDHAVHIGRILTGDQFLTSAERETHRYLTEELQGAVVEMEGASIATVAYINAVPFLAIRTVSDRANEEAHLDFEKFLPVASENSFELVRHLLDRL